LAIIICSDGLGGNPEVNFCNLKSELENAGHKIVLVNTADVYDHEDRVNRVLKAYTDACSTNHSLKIFLLGYSAGGSAVRIVAEKYNDSDGGPDGVIMLSPAMPRFVWFCTGTLVRIMFWRTFSLLFAKTLNMTENETSQLLGPLSKNMLDQLISASIPISTKEARKLAFFPNKFLGFKCPVLHIYGDADRWISPRAQRKLADMLRQKNPLVTSIQIPDSGHVILFSEHGNNVIKTIREWVQK